MKCAQVNYALIISCHNMRSTQAFSLVSHKLNMKEMSLLLLPIMLYQMKTRAVKMHLSLAFLIFLVLGIRNCSQKSNSEDDHDGNSTIHASDDYQTAMEMDVKGTKITRKELSKSSCKN